MKTEERNQPEHTDPLGSEAPPAQERDEDAESAEESSFEDPLKLYLKDVHKGKLLSAQEERNLGRRVAKGDMAARERMIESNLRLVVKIAKRYVNKGLAFPDLIEEGNMGLIKAVDRFQVSKGCRFSTYATWWIRQSIERALVNQGRTIRLPVHIAEDVSKMLKVAHQLERQLGREPDAYEIAQVMVVEADEVSRLQVMARKTYSLEHPLGEEGDFSLFDTVEDEDLVNAQTQTEDLEDFAILTEWMDTLSEDERRILTLRFGLEDTPPQTLAAIGSHYGVTRERIRQIQEQSLDKLRALRAERTVEENEEEDVGPVFAEEENSSDPRT